MSITLHDPAVDEVFLTSGTLPLVPAAERAAHYKRMVEAHEADRKAKLTRDRFRLIREGVQVTVILGLGAAIAGMMPLKQLVPVMLTANQADGTWRTSIVQSDLPASVRQNVLKATFWLYVNAREGYSMATHFHTDQKVVQMLSDKDVSKAYLDAVNWKNKGSPYAVYSKDATVRLERVSESLGCAERDCSRNSPDTYEVRYTRIEKREGSPERRTSHKSSLRFVYPPAIPAWQQVTYNPIGVQVIEYTRTDEGAGE
jgi:type IV secretory pathway component VirB8